VLRRALDSATGRPVGPRRYLIDSESGELVIAVSDLADAARRHVGTSLRHGWLDARMDSLGWERVTLQGHALPGRDGRRQGPHARLYVYPSSWHAASPPTGSLTASAASCRSGPASRRRHRPSLPPRRTSKPFATRSSGQAAGRRSSRRHKGTAEARSRRSTQAIKA
jgi:hypothetical protein